MNLFPSLFIKKASALSQMLFFDAFHPNILICQRIFKFIKLNPFINYVEFIFWTLLINYVEFMI
ncbi:hypothetical protein C0971_02305 [Bacillus methanolicus]|nr:hypothetical protein C0971_02305 [Bacillus methanolicus]